MPKPSSPDTSLCDKTPIPPEETDFRPQDFNLETFFPYLVRVFYSDVTQALSSVYQRDYGMMPAEWRTMAILGSAPAGLQASEIVTRSSMDKVVVSRAVKRMEERGFLLRESNAADGRSFLLKLSDSGRAAFEDLAPKLLKVEREMLEGLSAADVDTILSIMQRIRGNLARHVDAGTGEA
ncbi:MarR family transcriptional regulator [Roseibium denhamense]|uniref:DNA-binding transcriptional regulator, MarR family n=1 Tax=Roseibium denhamense TaxID=76305 RepID=A0ABY1N8N3_9HYPH|nr:MarR family transcriptional regulator [Roseibium denhamense]MTI05623.1 MarR family transcriptional regulator [Roseibium denhamense]SMP03239.1 DNA-binding transcriptional regulator, MarR family [Roseibium denhamense]